MKRLLTILAIAAFLISSSSTGVAFAAGEYKDNVVDQAGDWFATLGKEGFEKDRILAERKTQRAAKHAEAEAKKAAKEAEKAGGDLKKKMGF